MRWATVKAFPAYEVSDTGLVRNRKTKRILKPSVTIYGYQQVGLYNFPNYKLLRVNRLVADAFVENPTKAPYVNHMDGNKLNNRADNLEWCDASHNTQHAYDIGLYKPAVCHNTGGAYN